MSGCDHSPPPDSAFAWSLWATCACGEVEYRQGQTKEARFLVISEAHYDNLRAPDGTPIDSRTKHRAYMKAHGVTTADDFKETWQRAKEAKAARVLRHDTGQHRNITETVGRLAYQLRTQKGRKR